jgi:hypothetical protein
MEEFACWYSDFIGGRSIPCTIRLFYGGTIRHAEDDGLALFYGRNAGRRIPETEFVGNPLGLADVEDSVVAEKEWRLLALAAVGRSNCFFVSGNK